MLTGLSRVVVARDRWTKIRKSFSIRRAAWARLIMRRWPYANRSAEAKSAFWSNEQNRRDDWPRAWKWLGPVFGRTAPQTVRAEHLLSLRTKIVQQKSEREAHRVIKVWRALWKRLPALGFKVDKGADPSLAF